MKRDEELRKELEKRDEELRKELEKRDEKLSKELKNNVSEFRCCNSFVFFIVFACCYCVGLA